MTTINIDTHNTAMLVAANAEGFGGRFVDLRRRGTLRTIFPSYTIAKQAIAALAAAGVTAHYAGHGRVAGGYIIEVGVSADSRWLGAVA